jgi:hypothetical protein
MFTSMPSSFRNSGIIAILFAAATLYNYWSYGTLELFPLNIVAVVGVVALFLLGILAIELANCVRKLQDRIVALEKRSVG